MAKNPTTGRRAQTLKTIFVDDEWLVRLASLEFIRLLLAFFTGKCYYKREMDSCFLCEEKLF